MKLYKNIPNIILSNDMDGMARVSVHGGDIGMMLSGYSVCALKVTHRDDLFDGWTRLQRFMRPFTGRCSWSFDVFKTRSMCPNTPSFLVFEDSRLLKNRDDFLVEVFSADLDWATSLLS